MSEKLMTVKELSGQIQFAPQTIYNKIHNGEFVLNIHYYKPSPKKILFIWSAVEEWLKGKNINFRNESDEGEMSSITSLNLIRPKNRINI
jgi:predicted DNA-binding transcriptional regulator AlpA